MPNTKDPSRQAFEAWCSSPPHERPLDRYPEHDPLYWPGQYRDYTVQLAWDAWCAAKKTSDQAHRPPI